MKLQQLLESIWKKPIDEKKTVETSKGLKVTLHIKQTYDSPEHEDGEYLGGTVTAYVNNREVGILPYGFSGGPAPERIQVGDLVVTSSFQRKGIASAMFDFVRSFGVPLEHYQDENDMTPAGRAFAKSKPTK